MTPEQIALLNQIEHWLAQIIATLEFQAIADNYLSSKSGCNFGRRKVGSQPVIELPRLYSAR